MSGHVIARHARLTRGTRARTATTMSIRHQTSGSAGSEISLPRMAVKPHSRTQKWIWSWALVVGFMGDRAAKRKYVRGRRGYARASHARRALPALPAPPRRVHGR